MYLDLCFQLRIARSGLHDVFFKVPVKERMSYIAHSRAVARAKETKGRVTRVSVWLSYLLIKHWKLEVYTV